MSDDARKDIAPIFAPAPERNEVLDVLSETGFAADLSLEALIDRINERVLS
ncbi:MAG: hypothetical protein AAGE80_02925 [Pseudomonadota bacterium]